MIELHAETSNYSSIPPEGPQRGPVGPPNARRAGAVTRQAVDARMLVLTAGVPGEDFEWKQELALQEFGSVSDLRVATML